MLEKKEASSHALTTRDRVALTCAPPHLSQLCFHYFHLICQQMAIISAELIIFIMTWILPEVWIKSEISRSGEKYQLEVLLGNF